MSDFTDIGRLSIFSITVTDVHRFGTWASRGTTLLGRPPPWPHSPLCIRPCPGAKDQKSTPHYFSISSGAFKTELAVQGGAK